MKIRYGVFLQVQSMIYDISLQLTLFANPRMHQFHIPECSIQNRNVHTSVLNEALWDMEQVHSEICEIGLLLCCVQYCVRVITLSRLRQDCVSDDDICLLWIQPGTCL